MTTLKSKTISGLLWSAVDNFSEQAITFVIGIVLARLLTPAEFGLIGMIAVFIAVSDTFIRSGFSQALIRRRNCTETDYSTVFYFNLGSGILFFLILFLSAPFISSFFNEPQLQALIRVLGLVLVVRSLTIIQSVILTKRIDFKLQTKISVSAAILSGTLSIAMAGMGYGVWSLVVQILSKEVMNSLLLWLWNKWAPLWKFSRKSFKELFSFGYKLLISGLIDSLYRNIYYLVIGKFFSASELGFYTRAQTFNDLPSKNLNGIISRVTYPVLSEIQDNPVKLKFGYKKMIQSVMLVSMVLMALLAAVAEPLVLVLIGQKWQPAIIYLQLLTFVSMMYPLHALNLNMLQVQGRSDLFLRLEIIKKIIAIPVIVTGALFSIKIMILAMWFNTIIAYYLNSYWSGKLIHYSIGEQIRDILPGLFIALATGMLVMLTGLLLPESNLGKLIVQAVTGILVSFFLCEIFKPAAYIELRQITVNYLFARLKKKS